MLQGKYLACLCFPTQSSVADPEVFQQSHAIRTSEDTTNAAECNEESEGKMSEDGYEVMNRIGPRGDSPKANIMLVKESSSPPVGGAVNLILSFGSNEDSQVQVLDLPTGTDEKLKETSEPVHRVRSTKHKSSPNISYIHDLFKEKRTILMLSSFDDHFSTTTLHGISLSVLQVIPFSFGIHNFLFSPRSLPQPAVPQSSACKKFWRRCQGILENTFGSLKRKKKIYRQSADEVICAV